MTQNLKINTGNNQMCVQQNEESSSSVKNNTMKLQMRSEMVKKRTYVRQKELRDGFKLSAESYRQLQNYKPEEQSFNPPETKRSEQKSKSLAAHIRDIESDIQAERNKDLGIIYLDAPRMIRTGSKWDSIADIRKLRMQQMFDHKKFNVFLASKFGQYLLDGIDDPELEKEGITRVSQFIKEKKTYQKAQQRAKNDVCAIVKQSMVFSGNQKTQAKVIDQKAPYYLQELQKMFNSNQFCKSAQKMFEFYQRKLQNVDMTVEEQQRIQKVIVKELKQHTFVQSNKTLTVDQLMRRLEETGPDKLEIDLKKELKRWVIVMNVFQSFLMMMGLPWKEITLENLDKKMNILDKLTKEDMSKFMVDLRPELLDDEAVASDTGKKAKQSKMKIRIGRKNNKEKDDVYNKLMKQSAMVIQEIMNKRRRMSVSLTRTMVSPKSSKGTTVRSDDQPTSLVNLALKVSDSPLQSPMYRTKAMLSNIEHQPTPKKQVVFNEPMQNMPSQIVEESQSSLSSSSETSSSEKNDPFFNVVRVYKNPYATFQEKYITEIKTQKDVIEKQYSQKPLSPTPQYDPVVAMKEGMDIKEQKLTHRKSFGQHKKCEHSSKQTGESQLTSEQLTKQLEKLNAIREMEKQASEYDASTRKVSQKSTSRLDQIRADTIKIDSHITRENKKEKHKSSVTKNTNITQSAKNDTMSQSTRNPQNQSNRVKKQETMSINELQDQLRKQLSMGAKYYDELAKNQEFLRNLPKKSRPKTVKIGERNSLQGLNAHISNENVQTGETLASYAGFKTPIQQSRVVTERMLSSSTGQPNARSAVFYRTQRVGSLAGKQSDTNIIASGRFQKTSQEKRMDDQIKFAKILHENRVKYFQKERVKSAVHGRRNYLQSFDQSNARRNSNGRNSVTFATQEAPIDKAQSGTGLKPQLTDYKTNRWLTDATSGKQSVENGTEETESAETESVQRGDSVNMGLVQVNKTRPRPKSSAITINSRRSQGSLQSKKLSGMSHYRNETTSRITAMNERLLKNCDELAAQCTNDTSEDVYDQHDELIKVIENMQEKNEIACNPQQLYSFNKVRGEIQHEKQTVDSNYLGEKALQAYKKCNKEVSLYLFKMKKLTKEQKLWRAQPITINRISELGKILAAHS